ncbi:MAG TPA: HAMP domain-containing protein [Hellea balneolensis]|uniref:histidine kinase n=1 Tax=Hellea balneolensis TaxID=287478 RepID=A0A7C5LYF5_9PROT|nr:HAMP domain-containing protein [Hellea balneolensis]
MTKRGVDTPWEGAERANEGWLKRRLPKTLFGRAFLIIMLPIALMQIIVAYIFFDAHWQTVTASLSDSVSADVAVTVELYEQSPNAERAKRLDAMLRPNMQLSVAYEEDDQLPLTTRRSFFSSLDRTLRKALSSHLTQDFWFDTTRYPNHIDIRVAVDGGVLRFIVPRERVFAPTGFIFLFWLIMATVLLSLVSILFILNQARPIVKLAEAADRFGKGQGIGKFKPSGAREVRQAGRSFLEMRERIQRHIQQRTELLAGVSHDLRTPLTRLKLHLALAKDSEETQAAKRDLEDMERMLDGYLDFARDSAQEERVAGDIGMLIEQIVQALAKPKPEFTFEGNLQLNMRRSAMKRALSNLINNGLKYAKHVKIHARASDEGVTITIDDDGPGIAPENREDAFKPFSRLDVARNQNLDGVGLGLSIARDVIQSHGGAISLQDSPLGGLRCHITLPR